ILFSEVEVSNSGFCYGGYVLSMKKILSSGLVFAGMLSSPVAVTNAETPDPASEYQNDPRLDSLNRFFQKGDCPAQDFSADFLRVADQNNLDWRLLPSISMVESG